MNRRFEGWAHLELREVGRSEFGFWILDFHPPVPEKPQITQMNADVELGFPPAPNQTADTATAAEGCDRPGLPRQRPVFVEDTGSVAPVDQSPGHGSDLIEGLECLSRYQAI
jgi:hypothetical protein